VHVELVVTDPAVQIHDVDIVDVASGASIGVGPVPGSDKDLGPLELSEFAEDTVSIYTSTEQAPEVAELAVHLRVTGYVSWAPQGALLLTTIALGFAIAIGDMSPDKLAVLVLPSTFAATVAVIREQSTLAMRLQSGVHKLLGAAILLLYLVACLRLAGGW
jgi:hypothetical protein